MIGVSSLCMLDHPLETVLETVSDTFSHIEVIHEGNHTDLEVLESYDMTVSFHAPFSDLNIASLNKAILKESLKQISASIEKAAQYNVEAVCIHPGHISPLGMHFKENIFLTQISSLKMLSQKAEEFNLILGVENMPNFFNLCARTPQEIEEIFHHVNSDNLRFTFDVGHALITGDVHQFLSLKEYMVIAHLHDNDGRNDDHLALGEGQLDFHIMRELHDVLLVIEVNAYPDAVKSLHQLQEILAKQP